MIAVKAYAGVNDTRNGEISRNHGDDIMKQERTSGIKYLIKAIFLLLTAILFPGCGNVPVSQKITPNPGEQRIFVLEEIRRRRMKRIFTTIPRLCFCSDNTIMPEMRKTAKTGWVSVRYTYDEAAAKQNIGRR